MNTSQTPIAALVTEAILTAEADAPRGQMLASLPKQLQDIEAWISVPAPGFGEAPTLTVTHSSR